MSSKSWWVWRPWSELMALPKRCR
uniref:Uncharacterized protein n=1 Tax=Arundo donax TaxID=35708 RepID=A0A0A9FC29_ARUDO